VEDYDGVEEMKRLLLLFLVACSPVVVFDSDSSFNVDFAITPAEKAKGLMYRSSIPDDYGMLFIFDENAPRSFWMKNTLIPLDMIFVGSDMKVVEIKAAVPPCESDPCPSYVSLPAKYVFEINSGLAEKNNIKVGSVMSCSYCK